MDVGLRSVCLYKITLTSPREINPARMGLECMVVWTNVQAKQENIIKDSDHELCQKQPKCHRGTSEMNNE